MIFFAQCVYSTLAITSSNLYEDLNENHPATKVMSSATHDLAKSGVQCLESGYSAPEEVQLHARLSSVGN